MLVFIEWTWSEIAELTEGLQWPQEGTLLRVSRYVVRLVVADGEPVNDS